MNNNSQNISEKEEMVIEEINAETKKLQSLNADIDKEFGKFLKPDYKPEGAPANDLKEKVIEASDKKEQDEMTDELDSALVDIFSHISDIRSQE